MSPAPFGRRTLVVAERRALGPYVVLVVGDPGGPAPAPGQFSMLAAAEGWGGGEDERPYLPRAVDLRRKSLREKFFGTFRCQTYWLLATRGAWRVLWSIARTGRFEPGKTDRVTRDVRA